MLPSFCSLSLKLLLILSYVTQQEHLLAGGYEGGQLVSFYRDVLLVLQNALAFNEESTAIAQAAIKLQVDRGAVHTRLIARRRILYFSLNLSVSPFLCDVSI